MRLRTFLSVILALLALAAPAGAAVAPGRVTFPLGDGQPRGSVDAFGLDVGAALPDGGVVLAGVDPGKGVVLAQLHADGSLDPSFGQGGIAHVAVPYGNQMVGPDVLQLLRRPDGRLVVVYTGAANSRYEAPQLALAGLTAGGALDPTFGQSGIAKPGIEGSCANCSPAALAADGSVAVTGNTGAYPPTIEHDPNVKPNFTWVVARLTPTGALDPTFGQGGVATLPGASARGLAIAVLTGGRVATVGQDSAGVKLARLLPNGALDPSWNGGQPAAVPTSLPWSFAVLARTTGAVDVLSSGSTGAELRRYTTTGALDTSFGGGVVTLPGGPSPQDLLAAPDGSELVVGPTTLNPQLAPPAERIARVAPDGTVSAQGAVPTPFGGGVATFFARHRAPSVTSLNQSGFHAGHPVVRANGSLVVPGTVNVVQYTGEGVGFEVEQAAIAAIAPSLSLDGSFGGAASPAKLTLTAPRQRASTALGRLAVTVVARTSGPGLALITVKWGHRTIAKSIAPVLRGGAQRLQAFLTLTGRRALRHRHGVRISVRATFEDLVAQRASASARGTLR